MIEQPLLLWGGFLLFVVAMLALDLGVVHTPGAPVACLVVGSRQEPESPRLSDLLRTLSSRARVE